jgi:hypothetical protein
MNVNPSARTSILYYASEMLGPVDAACSGTVIDAAAPLLDWAGQASGEKDLRLRMDAMSRADSNLVQANIYRRRNPALKPLSVERLLAEARAYYAFIAETAPVEVAADEVDASAPVPAIRNLIGSIAAKGRR